MDRIKNVLFLWVLCFFITFSSGIVYAQDSYQTEISAGYSHQEDENETETIQYGVGAEIHFSAVNTAGHPLAEADFLERIGSIAIVLGKNEFKADSVIDIEADGPFYGALLTYAKPDFPIVLQAIYAKSELEFEPPWNVDLTSEAYGLGIGYFLDKSLLAEVQYTHIDTEISSSNSSLSVDGYAFIGKFVNELSNGTAYNLEGSIGIEQFDDESDDGSNTILGIAGDYYFNQKVSLGAGFALNSGDDKDDEGNTYGLDLKAFLNSQLGVNVGYEQFIADNDEGEDEESYDVSLIVRF